MVSTETKHRTLSCASQRMEWYHLRQNISDITMCEPVKGMVSSYTKHRTLPCVSQRMVWYHLRRNIGHYHVRASERYGIILDETSDIAMCEPADGMVSS